MSNHLPIDERFTPETRNLLKIARKATEQLNGFAENADTPWQPSLEDPRRLHNTYIKNLVDA